MKLRISVQRDERADVATRRILHPLLDAMEANEAGLRADADSEFLHDFRVAVRRTRSALGQIKGVFPTRTTERFRREFAWLGQVTGPTRDLDVHLLQFDRYRDRLPQSMRADLEPLREFLRRQQQQEHRRLIKALDGARYRDLRRAWHKFLEQRVPKRPSAASATRPIVNLARDRILRMHRRALKEGTAITPQSPNEALHELRKTCKKLRYLMEFFCGLFSKDNVDHLVKELKRLQDNLGELQDLEVQSTAMTRFEALMKHQRALNAPTRAAMDWLVKDMQKRKKDVRRKFARRFDKFARPEVSKRFRATFGSDKPSQSAASS